MNTNVTARTFLNLVENLLKSQKDAEVIGAGIYLKNGKHKIFVKIGEVKLITVFFKGEMKLFLNASPHINMKTAEQQAKEFLKQINNVFDDVGIYD